MVIGTLMVESRRTMIRQSQQSLNRALAPTSETRLSRIQSGTERPGKGPEALRSIMARLQPADLRMSRSGDEILQRFQLKLLTEGSGTQLFSTSFAQWTAREVLRRAQPLTLLAVSHRVSGKNR